ncbi:pyroglutamyl-peptidase I family protein [Halalkalicoccus subterraneus]|uniref:pyroglutamyl-peptidase I family protein n=1 Tax=Halalkalicoccus subterraneus TaxID=2675002 RepID=UPI000EFB5140|nr:pyrrolidone-carboxylate peptidase [Halalkalicoccus subterraneus]
MTVLLTGYEPFAEHETNPSERLATHFNGETVDGEDVVGRVLPVEFARVENELLDAIDEVRPDRVLSAGLAAGRSAISVERVAINVADAGATSDNAGSTPHDERIVPEGPDAYFANVPVVDCVETLLEAGIPARVSNTAGTHCCNRALYTVRHHTNLPAGFVHLPYTPAEAARNGTTGSATSGGSVPASMSFDDQRRAMESLIPCCRDGAPARSE